jgi:hypothetical protein
MTLDPCGPEVVVGQLQFEFDGVTVLTLEEKLRQWLNSQDDEAVDADMLTAMLFIADNSTRRRRADRWNEIVSLQTPYRYDPVWAVSGGVEAMWLYNSTFVLLGAAG